MPDNCMESEWGAGHEEESMEMNWSVRERMGAQSQREAAELCQEEWHAA